MYQAFFGLKRSPFEISPDPHFFYSTQRHNEALANLFYGIRRQKGFVVVTGEVGTGKTLLLQCLLQRLRGSQTAFAYVFNTRLSPTEFLDYVVGDLGLTRTVKGKSELLLTLNNYLIDRYKRGLSTALIVDEAQNLRADVLEEIRLLTNLETAQQKLLQIVLVGQPELDKKLDSTHLRQLKQRVALRCCLEPLSAQETPSYIRRRLELAGAIQEGNTIFPEDATNLIHCYSQGIPRLINTLCENAMLTAYAMQTRTVTVQMVEEVAKDFRLQIPGVSGQAVAGATAEPLDQNNALKTVLSALRSNNGSSASDQDVPKTHEHIAEIVMRKRANLA